jgi:hypothetical protein
MFTEVGTLIKQYADDVKIKNKFKHVKIKNKFKHICTDAHHIKKEKNTSASEHIPTYAGRNPCLFNKKNNHYGTWCRRHPTPLTRRLTQS